MIYKYVQIYIFNGCMYIYRDSADGDSEKGSIGNGSHSEDSLPRQSVMRRISIDDTRKVHSNKSRSEPMSGSDYDPSDEEMEEEEKELCVDDSSEDEHLEIAETSLRLSLKVKIPKSCLGVIPKLQPKSDFQSDSSDDFEDEEEWNDSKTGFNNVTKLVCHPTQSFYKKTSGQCFYKEYDETGNSATRRRAAMNVKYKMFSDSEEDDENGKEEVYGGNDSDSEFQVSNEY